MNTLADSVPQPMRSPWSFMGSVCLHCWVLAWVALGPSIGLERPKSLYDREIQPNEKKIVWYKLSDRLPDVTPPEAKRAAHPTRAKAKFDQNIAAGAKDNSRVPQLILAPAPEIAPAKPLPLPNIVAVAPPPRLVRPFIPPPLKAPTPDNAVALPDAPKLATAPERKAPALDLKVKRPSRPRFIPAAAPKLALRDDPPPLPSAPELNPAASFSGPLPIVPRKFVPPPKQAPAPAGPTTIAGPPPALTAAAALPSENSLVIAGLNPSKSLEVPAPPGSVKGSFSGGPKVQPKDSDGARSDALLEIPSLTVQGGARDPQPPVMVARVSPTSPESLAAAMRAAHGGTPPAIASNSKAVRVAGAPDPRMYGRQVYTMALQMPNLTSRSGSWLVWFAEHESDIANANVDMRPPLPLHEVSPRYIASAVEERVEGKVRLWAVIGKDGHVTGVSLLQHLDDRLDRSAEEALGKWQFQPALRNGIAIEVDAVFEIPFYLGPKNAR